MPSTHFPDKIECKPEWYENVRGGQFLNLLAKSFNTDEALPFPAEEAYGELYYCKTTSHEWEKAGSFGSYMVTTTNNTGERTSALHLAARGKRWGLFKLLLPHVDVHLTHENIANSESTHGAMSNSNSGNSLLATLIGSNSPPDVFSAVIRAGVDINETFDWNDMSYTRMGTPRGSGNWKGLTIFKKLLQSDDVELLSYLIGEGLDVNKTCTLRPCVRYGDDGSIQILSQAVFAGVKTWAFLLFQNHLKGGIPLPNSYQVEHYYSSFWCDEEMYGLQLLINILESSPLLEVKNVLLSVLFGDGCLYLPPGTNVEKQGEVFFAIPIDLENFKIDAVPEEVTDDKQTVSKKRKRKCIVS